MNATGENKIEFNLSSQDRIQGTADDIAINGTRQINSGGTIAWQAKNTLTQMGNSMKASDGGKIINESEGVLEQVDNEMSADANGEIRNISKKGALGILGILSLVIGFFGLLFDIFGIINPE